MVTNFYEFLPNNNYYKKKKNLQVDVMFEKQFAMVEGLDAPTYYAKHLQ